MIVTSFNEYGMQIVLGVTEDDMTGITIEDGGVLKQGDTSPALVAQLFENGDEVVELDSSSMTVLFGARYNGYDDLDSTEQSNTDEYLTGGYEQSGQLANYTEGSVYDENGGRVEFDWRDASTTEQVGTYDIEFVIVESTGQSGDKIRTFPADGFEAIEINEGM